MFDLIPFLVSLSLTFVLMPLAIRLGLAWHWCDDPKVDNLKVHKRPIPFSAGLLILVASSLSWLNLFFVGLKFKWQIICLIIAGVLVWFLGFWGDCYWEARLPGASVKKLFWQIAISLGAIFILSLSGWQWHWGFGLWLWVLPAVYLIGSLNSHNVIDGLDGLAGGLGLISGLGFTLLAYWQNDWLMLYVSLGLAGALFGFLIFNFNPAVIFMGDNGSYFIGFVLAVLAIRLATDLKSFIYPLFLLGLPILNQAYVIIKRLALGKKPWQAGRDHFYDDLWQRYGSVKKAVIICYLIQLVLVGSGLLLAR